VIVNRHSRYILSFIDFQNAKSYVNRRNT